MCFFCQVLKEHIIWRTLRVLCVCNNGLVRHAMSGCMEFFFRAAFACLQMQENTWMTSSSGTVWFHGSSQRWSAARWRAAREPHCNINYIFKNIFKNGLPNIKRCVGCLLDYLHVCKCRITHEWHHLQELSGSIVLQCWSTACWHAAREPHFNRNYIFKNLFKNGLQNI